jgi:hypothetical protein
MVRQIVNILDKPLIIRTDRKKKRKSQNLKTNKHKTNLQ